MNLIKWFLTMLRFDNLFKMTAQLHMVNLYDTIQLNCHLSYLIMHFKMTASMYRQVITNFYSGLASW